MAARLLPAAGERQTSTFLRIRLFFLSILIYSTIDRFLPTAAIPFRFRIDGRQRPSAAAFSGLGNATEGSAGLPHTRAAGWEAAHSHP